MNDDGSINIKTIGYDINDDTFQSTEAVATCDGAHCIVDFNGNKADYWILSTDYLTYTLIYSCSDLGNGQKFEAVWLLSRTPELDQAT